MNKDIKLYHGSQQIINNPTYGIGKPYNDYGRGFYCTESIELAKEWACPLKKDGYANEYILHTKGLNILYLTKEPYNILSWMAILLKNRKFDINNNIGSNGKDYLLEHYLIDVSDVDVIIGYRADDSYFSFAEDFVNNVISLRDLNIAMQLGSLGEQVVLVSEKAFEHIEFNGYETADFSEYYYKRVKRDDLARESYRNRKKELTALKDDIFMIDIIREGMKADDARIQFYLSK